MNIYDISNAAGVSIATVSRVLNGSGSVSPVTREKVLRIIKESGYTPNAFARGLGLGTMKTIGILCADSSDSFLSQAIYFIEQGLRQGGYDTLLCCTGYGLSSKQSSLKLLMSKKVDGVVFVGSQYIESDPKHNSYILEAAKSIPVMILNGSLEGDGVYCTYSDSEKAIYELTTAMIRSGIRKPIYLYSSLSYSGRRKLTGFMSAASACGVTEPERAQFYDARYRPISDIRDYLCSLDERGLLFDGVVCADDRLAVGAVKYAALRGLSIPYDFCVTGFNNSDLATCSTPEITSVDNKLEAICVSCVSSLMDLFSEKNIPKQTVFSYDIIKRDTTRN